MIRSCVAHDFDRPGSLPQAQVSPFAILLAERRKFRAAAPPDRARINQRLPTAQCLVERLLRTTPPTNVNVVVHRFALCCLHTRCIDRQMAMQGHIGAITIR